MGGRATLVASAGKRELAGSERIGGRSTVGGAVFTTTGAAATTVGSGSSSCSELTV